MPTKRGLSKRGINKLEKVMLANKKYYNQECFGCVTVCGTFMCASSFAHFIEVGPDKFEREAKRNSRQFAGRCLRAGKRLLGVDTHRRMVPIFDSPCMWPEDLREGFDRCRGPISRVRFYIKMLRTRANVDGSLREKNEK